MSDISEIFFYVDAHLCSFGDFPWRRHVAFHSKEISQYSLFLSLSFALLQFPRAVPNCSIIQRAGLCPPLPSHSLTSWITAGVLVYITVIIIGVATETCSHAKQLENGVRFQVAVLVRVAIFTATGCGASCCRLLTVASCGAVGGAVRTVTVWGARYFISCSSQ